MDDYTAQCAPFIGVPRVYHGKTPAGWDCWGLVRYIGVNVLGFNWPDFDDAYQGCADHDPDAVSASIQRYLGQWRATDPRPGTIACFDMRGARRRDAPCIFHVGLIVSRRTMIHVCADPRLCTNSGTVIEPFNGLVWQPYFYAAMEYCGGQNQ